MTKIIFIRDYSRYLYNIDYKKGDIVEAILKTHGNYSYYIMDHVPDLILDSDTVMSLANWREQQINDILNES